MKKLLCLLLAIALLAGPALSAAAEENPVLPQNDPDAYDMRLSMCCYMINHTRVLKIFPTACNMPITGMRLVFAYDSSNTALNSWKLYFDDSSIHTEKVTTGDQQTTTVTITASNDTPYTHTEGEMIDLRFSTTLPFNEHVPFDFRIVDIAVMVPLAGGGTAEYHPGFPDPITVPVIGRECNMYLDPDLAAQVENAVAWGVCKPTTLSVWWLDKDGTLTIEGTEKIPDYDDRENKAPWAPYRDQIKKLVLGTGIGRIGTYAFYNCPNLEEVVFPDKTYGLDFNINAHAFDQCPALSKLSPLPENTNVWIGSMAFAGTSFQTMHLTKFTKVEKDTFQGNLNLAYFTAAPDCLYLVVDEWGGLISKANGVVGEMLLCPQGLAGEYHVPYDHNGVPDRHFYQCRNITKLVLSEGSIRAEAFRDCGASEIYFPGSAPYSIAGDAFQGVTATVYYPAGDASWTEDKMQQYGGNLTWVAHTHTFSSREIAPTCLEQGYQVAECSGCGYRYQSDPIPALGHDMTAWETAVQPGCATEGMDKRCCSRCDYFETQPTLAAGHNWEAVTEGRHSCSVCGLTEGKYRLYLTSLGIAYDRQTAWVDGVAYPVQMEAGKPYVALEHPDATCLTRYTYANEDNPDIHTQYPMSMQTWLLTCPEDCYTARTDHNLFYNSIMDYAGSSIRIKGVKGIRMITAVHEDTRKLLIDNAYEQDGKTYKLVEYGTVLSWASDLEGGNPLILGQPYAKSNYAYKRDVADPVFNREPGRVYYTNVLVGFTTQQCADDIAMRSYMIIEDQNGRQTTIYGGIVYRSIGYIAYQNRNAFAPGTNAYDYVWEIIHHVYEDMYDAEYKG